MVSTLRMLTSLMLHCHALLRCVVNRIRELGWAMVSLCITWHDDALFKTQWYCYMKPDGKPMNFLKSPPPVNHCPLAVVIKFTSISGVFGYPERQDSLQESHHERPETVLLTLAMLLRIEVVSFNHFQSVQGKNDVKR